MKLNAVIRVATGLIGLALFGYFMLFFTREATKTSAWHHAGSLWSENRILSDSVVVFTRIEQSDFLAPPYPLKGDTLVSINDSSINAARWNIYTDSLRSPGEEIPLEFRHAGDTLRSIVRMRTPPDNVFVLMVVLQVLRFLIAGLSIGVGLWAFFAQPDSGGVRALAFFSFAMGAFIIAGVTALSARFAAFQIPYIDRIHNGLMILAIFFGAFWVNLQLLFPRPAKFMRERPVLAYILCYGLPAALLVALPLSGIPQRILIALAITVITQIVIGLIVLAVRYKRAADRLERRQTRLVLLGSGTGLALLLLVILISNLFPMTLPGGLIGGLLMINASFVVLLLSPLSFAYAFGRYRLLEVEGKLRRGTRYVLVTGGMLAIVFALIYFIGSALVALLGINSRAAMLLLALGLGVLFARARGTLQERLERWIYPERRRLREMIHDFLQHALTIPDKETFWTELQTRLRDGLRVERVHPVLLIAGNGHYSCMNAGVTPFTTESEFLERLARERRPVLVDEVIASSRVNLTTDEADWLEEQHVGLVLPLVSHSSLIGFLGLGQKTEQEDYAAEELRILDSLSSQIAMASENIRLVEENIVKRQLEEQLQIARRVQQGFLPEEIPLAPGLEIAATSRFCLDVAGDYYDVIPLDDRQTVLAVGDVSGKGAGAALLMANLQASLRTAVGMGSPLVDVVARINDLIYRNTPPDQYITFFVAVYDAPTSRLTYVNAGHNPPLLVRTNGDTQMLSAGGLILGFRPGVKYEQETVGLRPGDFIIMYTDGVSEAMNAAEEEFGEKRICESVCIRRTQPIQQILSVLENEVVQFRAGNDCFDDDFTLLLARAS